MENNQLFRGIRYVLHGFDPVKKSELSRKLVSGGAFDADLYGLEATHFFVDKHVVYDDPACVAARHDGRIVLSSLWVDHSFGIGLPVDTTSIMYTPVRDINGIPGANSLLVCLTGYADLDREDIMIMAELMGAQFSRTLIPSKVTHLVCYKFEGPKYMAAKKSKTVKLVNRLWLEDCLRAWEILPEEAYSKSDYESTMEAEAGDSEPECVTAVTPR